MLHFVPKVSSSWLIRPIQSEKRFSFCPSQPMGFVETPFGSAIRRSFLSFVCVSFPTVPRIRPIERKAKNENRPLSFFLSFSHSLTSCLARWRKALLRQQQQPSLNPPRPTYLRLDPTVSKWEEKERKRASFVRFFGIPKKKKLFLCPSKVVALEPRMEWKKKEKRGTDYA